MKRKRMFSAGLTALLLLFFAAGSSLAQVLTVSGTVVDARTNTPLPGVNIVVQGTTAGTITDVNGKYSIRVENPSASLVFSYVGYVTQTIPVNSKTVIDVAMSEEVVALNELVVIGYGTQRRADLTGSIAVVDVPEVSKTATNDITKALQGQVAGVSIQSGGDPGAVPQILIRGIGSFNNNTPLYIVDGAVTPINDLPLASVESIQVLKDASAAAIYGSRAANGVIIITTKRGTAGKLNVTYDGYYGWQNITKRYDVCNREEYQMLVNEATRNAQVYDPTLQIMPANDPSSPYFVDNVDTDWQKEVFKTGNINQHNLGL
ncbi:MAG TPA: carboxypeptidase-like regulatory domain-containing protein, partial [Bacteroidales bacterium]|nr:carboxypeptidase-like regulatory domain-containing protein [Bacteroidales bacterium]